MTARQAPRRIGGTPQHSQPVQTLIEYRDLKTTNAGSAKRLHRHVALYDGCSKQASNILTYHQPYGDLLDYQFRAVCSSNFAQLHAYQPTLA